MTQRQRLHTYEQMMHKISLYVTVMNAEKIQEAIQLMDSWSYAHRSGNGELSEHQQQQRVDHVVVLMQEFING